MVTRGICKHNWSIGNLTVGDSCFDTMYCNLCGAEELAVPLIEVIRAMNDQFSLIPQKFMELQDTLNERVLEVERVKTDMETRCVDLEVKCELLQKKLDETTVWGGMDSGPGMRI